MRTGLLLNSQLSIVSDYGFVTACVARGNHYAIENGHENQTFALPLFRDGRYYAQCLGGVAQLVRARDS